MILYIKNSKNKNSKKLKITKKKLVLWPTTGGPSDSSDDAKEAPLPRRRRPPPKNVDQIWLLGRGGEIGLVNVGRGWSASGIEGDKGLNSWWRGDDKRLG